MKKNSFLLILVLLAGIFYQNSFAQLSGTKTIPGDYATISAAITALNSSGVGSGGVTFNVAAGFTETASNLVITATGTASNPIVFQKSGSGANPLITAGVGTGSMDGIILLSGVDYITFNAIDVSDALTNTTTTTQMEWGYALLKVDGTNGSQFNTIKNCTITLQKTNTSSVGIYSANHTTAATTALTVTDRLGSNSGNQYYSNSIRNCYVGIWMGGYNSAAPYDFYDHFNQIGVGGGNTIRLFGGGSSTSYGIYTIYQDSLAVSNNDIGGGAGGTSTNYGMMLSTSTNSSVIVYNNTVSDTTAATTSSSYGIALSNYGVTGTDNTVIVKRNTVQGMYGSALTTGALYGYYIYYTSAMNLYVDSNKFINNKWGSGTTTNTGAIYGLYVYASASGTPTVGSVEYISNNYVYGNVKKQSAIGGGAYYGIYAYYGQATVNAFNNVIEYDTLATTGSYYGIYIYNYYASLVNYYNNSVRNIYKKDGSTGTFYGIYASNAAYSTGIFNLYNNSVYNIRAGSASASLYGIYNAASPLTKNCYGNTIYTLLASVGGSVYGYYQSGGTTVSTYKNNIYDLRTSTGFGYGMTIASGTTNYVYNNFISDIRVDSLSNTLALMGMYISGGTTDYVYYNTIYLNSASLLTGTYNFGTAALYVSTSPTVELRNNVIVNNSSTGTDTSGYATAYYRSSNSLSTYSSLSNNNDFYAGTPGTKNIIFFDGTNKAQTLGDYKILVSPRDGGSVTENPPFINVSTKPYDLRINAAVASQLESTGSTVSTPVSIVDDFDGQARYPNSGYPVNPSYPPTAPDMGADEFGGIPKDVSGPNIVYTPLAPTNNTTARTLTATITDPSGVPTSGTGLPVLYWRTNAGSYSAVTATSLGYNQYSFTFGSGVIIGDVVYYYICAQDGLTPPNVSCSPAGGASGLTYNPPAATTPPTTPSSYVITQAGLSGDYTVGAALFNKITGKNITFNKVITKVMKEVYVDDMPVSKMPSKEDKIADETNAPNIAKGRKVMKEVEEISWVPMENGSKYDGPLYIKKNENPNYNYPQNINGIYLTLTAAVADFNLRGVTGPTRFLLTDTLYSTGETFPILVRIANEVNHTTTTNTLTIKPNTGVNAVITGVVPGSQIIRVLESNVIIDGSNTTSGTTRNLTIQNTSATTPSVVYVASVGTIPITNVTLKNSTIINGVTSSSAVILRDSTSAAGYFNNITFQNNALKQAYMGYYCNAVIATGNGSGLLITGNDINDRLLPVRLTQIYIQGVDGATVSNNYLGNDSNGTDASNITGVWLATGTVNTTISGNTIYDIYGYGAPRGIAVSSAVVNANVTITGNTISNLKTAYSVPPYGIYVFSSTSGVSVTKNKISTLLNTNTGGYGARGINIAVSTSPANVDVVNNFVSDIKCTSDASATYYNVGIALDGTMSNINVYANSVNLFGYYAGYTSATVSAALYVSSGVTLANIRDNIFVNSYNNTISTTDKSYSVYSAATNTAYTDINYNDYFVSDSAGVFGYLGGAITSLSGWQTATGKDGNSVSGYPQFIDTINLHIDPLLPSPVSNAGQFIATVTQDIDGNTRSTTTPDIGADEYTFIPPAPLAPALVSPPSNSTSIILSPTLVWNKVLYAEKYNLLLSTDSTFGTVLLNDSTITDSLRLVTNLNPLTKYYWKVRTGNISGWSAFSGTYNFKTMGNPTQVVLLSPANGATGQQVSLTCVWNKAVDQTDMALLKGKKFGKDEVDVISKYWYEISTDSTFTTGVTRDSSLTDTTKSLTGLANSTKYYWRVKAKNETGWGAFSTKFNFTTIASTLSLNLKVYLEGFWDGSTHVSDTVRVYLANATTPHAYVDTAKVVLSTTGTSAMTFSRATGGSYYIVIEHRNHLQTWSATAQAFTPGTPLSYDFTTSSGQAFGNNMKQLGSAWMLYGGDPNMDGSIDAVDIGIFITQFGSQGYLSCDFNGDQDVNASDVQIIASNFGLTIAVPSVDWQPMKRKLDINDLKTVIKNSQKNGKKNTNNN